MLTLAHHKLDSLKLELLGKCFYVCSSGTDHLIGKKSALSVYFTKSGF